MRRNRLWDSPAHRGRESARSLEPSRAAGPWRLPLRGAAVAVLLIAALVFTGAPTTARGVNGEELEDEVKAGFLYNFLKFAEWPVPAGGEPPRELVVAVLADREFGETAEKSLRGRTAQGRGVRVLSIAGVEDLRKGEPAVHLLFVGSGADPAAALAALDSRPVLTVGQQRGFCQRGGMINLVREGERLRFEINPAAAESRGVRLSSKLLSLARIVASGEAP